MNRTVSSTIQGTIDSADPGDTILVPPGEYREAITVRMSNITIRAVEPKRCEVNATGKPHAMIHGGAKGVTVEGIVFRGAANAPQPRNAMVRPGSGWSLRDCVFSGARGAGLGLKSVRDVEVVDCVASDNMQIGIGCSEADDVLIKRTIISGNNPGFTSDPRINVNGKNQTVLWGGRWYIKPGFEAGGTKFNRTKNLVVDGCDVYANHGPGLWFDYGNEDGVVRNCTVHDGLSVDQSWQGIGIFIEFNKVGGFVIEDNDIANNRGSGIGIAESREVIIRSNRVVDDNIQFRDMPSRSSENRDIKITGNRFERAYISTSIGTWTRATAEAKRITIDKNAWVDKAEIRWGDATYETLDAIRSGLGFEVNGSISTDLPPDPGPDPVEPDEPVEDPQPDDPPVGLRTFYVPLEHEDGTPAGRARISLEKP